MKPLIEIYQAIADALRVPSIGHNWIDIDMGQLETEGVDLPLVYPAILLKFDDVTWKDKTVGVQIGVVTLSVKVIFQFQKEAEILSHQPTGRTEVVDFFNLLEAVHDKLTSISGTMFNKFVRFNQYQLNPKPKDLLWVQVLQYQCNILSDATTPGGILDVDYINVKDNNTFLERRKFNLIHK